jgi:hypothetical protein
VIVWYVAQPMIVIEMPSDVSSADTSIRRDIGCQTITNMIKGKTPEEIRKLFNIVNDFTPEEEVRPYNHHHYSANRLTPSNPQPIGSNQEGERVGRRTMNGSKPMSSLFGYRVLVLFSFAFYPCSLARIYSTRAPS